MWRMIAAAAAIISLLSVAGHPVRAESAGKVYRIGFLSEGQAEHFERRLAALRDGLRSLGYVEGRNILIHERYAGLSKRKIREMAAELVQLKADVIVTHGSWVPGIADRVATRAGRKTPIVMAVHADPVGTGVVASLAKPGGNITGLTDFHSQLVGKRLELLKEVVPSATKIAVLWNPATTIHPPQWKRLQDIAPSKGVTLLSLAMQDSDDLERAFSTMKRKRPAGLIVFGHPSISRYRKRTIKFALENRLPTIFTGARNAVAGGLIAYGVDFPDMYRRAATYIDKILKGAKPRDLPVEQPTRFYLTVNLNTAKALGIAIPRSILLRADKVIE